MVVIAECHDCIVHSLQSDVSAGRGRRGAEDQVVASTGWAVWLPTFRLFDLLGSRKVGELGSWRGAVVRAQEQKDRGGAAMQKRTDARSGIPEKGGGHTRLHLSPMKGRRRKESAPTHSHRTGRREERGINHSTEKGIPRTITPTQGGVDGTPGKTPLANGQLLPT